MSQQDALTWIVNPKWAIEEDASLPPEGLLITAVYNNAQGEAERYEVQTSRPEIDRFRQLWHYLSLWETTWMGVQICKYPTDLWIYQQLMVENRFDLIVECGTFCGGSALYLAQMCQLLGHGRVITIDIEDVTNGRRPKHPLIEYVTASSVDPVIVDLIGQRAKNKKVLVILDSDHQTPHVLKELQAYAPLAHYLIVEDTNVGGHPIRPQSGPGPGEAVALFLASGDGKDWQPDREREKFLLTANPGGYLRRRA